tara:strand:- start:649 stop:1608 length:960 start_codon:yes stop_codon:yes gene_type:complete
VKKSKVIITGGAGFVGSNLCKKFLSKNWQVVAIDNSITGTKENLKDFLNNPDFEFIQADITKPIRIAGDIKLVLHFASLASPVRYFKYPVETLRAGSDGTFNTLELAKSKGARYLVASSSEVYGDPKEYPQNEEYWGNVNSVGPRSMYDESKRFAEAVVMAYHRAFNLDTRIVRLFNSYGPRMKIDDGRVVAAFIQKALEDNPIQIFGDGTQTRSLCYVEDTVEGIYRISDVTDLNGEVFNIGNPDERQILELANLVVEFTSSKSRIEYLPARDEDPQRRCPDISKITKFTGWQPEIELREGVEKTIKYYRDLYKINNK